MAIFNLSETNQGGGGGGSYTVTINLMNPHTPSAFRSCYIEEYVDGLYMPIGSIASATGSATVSVDASARDIKLILNGGNVVPPHSVGDQVYLLDGIGLNDYTEGSSATMTFVVKDSGTIDIHSIEWDD